MREEPTSIDAILERATKLDPGGTGESKEFAQLTIELARSLLRTAHSIETRPETRARATLAERLASPTNQAFSVALTDRMFRSHLPDTAMATFLEVLERVDPSAELGHWDRLQLAAGRAFGPFMPDITMQALIARVNREARPFLLHADEPRLSEELANKRATVGRINLNYLGEEVLGENDAAARRAIYHALAQRGDIDALSVKLSGIDARLDILALEESVQRLWSSVSEIVQATNQASHLPIIYFDMEAYRDLEMAETLVHRLLLTPPAREGWPIQIQFGLAVQAYLPEALGLIERLATTSRTRVDAGYKPLRIRLVKGANLQTERVEASLRGMSCPVFPSKLETDAHYKRCVRRLVEHAQDGNLAVGIASHNLFDLAYALVLRANAQVEKSVQLEMLEGMSGAAGRAIAQATGALLIYAPAVHDAHLTSAVSYLVRRLDENAEPEHFLHDAAQMEVDDALFERQQWAFLTSLEESWITPPTTFRKQDRHAPHLSGRFNRRNEFFNAPDTDWTRPENRQWLKEHFARAKSSVRVQPLLSPTIKRGDTCVLQGCDPSVPEFSYPVELVTPQQIDECICAATHAHVSWSQTPLTHRVSLLREAAQAIESARGSLIAAMALDAAKRPVEADIEVSEAVDFARYYAHLAEIRPLYTPSRGVTVVTPPWNFPLAIPLGGVFAALVAGNTVLLKPAPETPWVAQMAVALCHTAGIPQDVLQFVPCHDHDASALIVDPRVSSVILTGATSTARLFLKMRPRLHLMAETGGKNCAYVSEMCDREQAIGHIIQSAFGHAGQKCSALSVLVLAREVFEDEQFKAQLLDATRTLTVGPTWNLQSYVTPLIHPPGGPLAAILKEGERYGTWLLKPKQSGDNARLLSPGILWDVQPGSFAQQTEFFGPILSVMCAENFDHALHLMNQSDYGLTAGLFSLRESEQERFVKTMDAGNLYINRPITGAVVGRQPFGGRKMSGFGPGAKAGGKDYLRQMVQPPAVNASQPFEEIRNNFEQTMSQHFARLHRGTYVYGENNYLRYQTAPTLLVVGRGTEQLPLATALLAKTMCNNQLPLFILSDEPAAQLEGLLAQVQNLLGFQLPHSPRYTSPGELLEYCKKQRVERVRTVGNVPDELFELCAQVPITVIFDPVSRDGLFELAPYLMSQSISHAYHRHGNIKLASLSRLTEVLEAESRHFNFRNG